MRRIVSSVFVTMLLMFLVIPAPSPGSGGDVGYDLFPGSTRGRPGNRSHPRIHLYCSRGRQPGREHHDGHERWPRWSRWCWWRRSSSPGSGPPDIKFEAGKLTFAVNQTMGERTMSTTYAATVTENTMEGTMTRPGMGGRGGAGAAAATPTPFKATKKEG